MPWACIDCGKTTKGFSKGETLCYVCRACKKRFEERNKNE